MAVLQSPDHALVLAIRALPGWGNAAHPYPDRSPMQGSFGDLLSTLLIATRGGEDIVTVSGQLDENGAGYVAVITPTTIVSCQLSARSASVPPMTVSIHSLSEVQELTVDAHHNHYEDSDQDRHRRMEFTVAIGDTQFAFRPASSSGLAGADAVLAGFTTILEGRE